MRQTSRDDVDTCLFYCTVILFYCTCADGFTHRGVNASGSCSGERGNVLSVGTYCYVAVCRRGRLGGARRFGAHRGRSGAGAYCGGRPPTACYYYYYCVVVVVVVVVVLYTRIYMSRI